MIKCTHFINISVTVCTNSIKILVIYCFECTLVVICISFGLYLCTPVYLVPYMFHWRHLCRLPTCHSIYFAVRFLEIHHCRPFALANPVPLFCTRERALIFHCYGAGPRPTLCQIVGRNLRTGTPGDSDPVADMAWSRRHELLRQLLRVDSSVPRVATDV